MMNKVNNLAWRGFTLIELLVVVAIIGILVSLSFPVISRIQHSARVAAARLDMQSIETAVEQYYSEYRRMPMPSSFHVSPSSPGHSVGVEWRGMRSRAAWERMAVPGGGWHHSLQYTDSDRGRLAICTIATLQGSNEFEGETTGFNPRQTQFLQVQEGRPLGHFMDPWSRGHDLAADPGNRMYSLLFDQNSNQRIAVAEITRVLGASYVITGKRVIICCYGPNRLCEITIIDEDFDDIYNIDIDKIKRAHGL